MIFSSLCFKRFPPPCTTSFQFVFVFSKHDEHLKGDFAGGIKRVEIVIFKKDTNWMVKVQEHSYCIQAVDDVFCKTRNIFHNDQIYFSCLTIINHLLEPFAVVSSGSANSLISVQTNIFPVGIGRDSGIIMLLLNLQTILWSIVLGGHQNVGSNPQTLRSLTLFLSIGSTLGAILF